MSQIDDRDDADVRAALHRAVSGVRPEGGLERIEERLGERTGSGWGIVLGTVAAVLATALVIGGVSWLNHEAKKPKPAPSTGREVTVRAYYLGDTRAGLRLFSEQRHLHDVRTSDLQAAVNAALGTPEDPDYKSFPGSPQATATSEGDVVVIDFSDPSIATYPLLDDIDAGMAIQTLVWTANDAVQRPVRVRFEIQGQPARSLLGKVLNGSVSEQAADTVLSPVSVELSEGQEVASGTTVLGKAATFEANVVWELRQGEQIVKQGFTTAGECCTLSPYAFKLEAPPGSYTLVVHDTDESGGEGGRGETSDSKDIVVTASPGN
jgi:hypothetical protein